MNTDSRYWFHAKRYIKTAAVFGAASLMLLASGAFSFASSASDEALSKVVVDGAKPFWINGGVYKVHKTTHPIKVDGMLDEPDWQNAEKAVFVIMGKNTKPRETAIGRVLYDDKYLYWSIDMKDSDIFGLSRGNNPETNFTEEDVSELFVKPDSKDPKYWPYGYWEFNVNPLGAYRDIFVIRRGASPTGRWLSYNSGWKAAVKVHGTKNTWGGTSGGWTVEAVVPFSAFSKLARKPVPGDKWKFMFGRYNYSVYFDDGLEYSVTASLTEDSFHHFEDFPYMEFEK